MALVTKRVYLDLSQLNDSKIPSGHTVNTTAASIGTARVDERVDFTVGFADFVALTAAAGFDDLIKTEIVSDIDAYIAAATGLGIDTTTHSVSYNAKVIAIALDANTDLYLNDANRNITVTVDLSVAVS